MNALVNFILYILQDKIREMYLEPDMSIFWGEESFFEEA